MNRDGDPVIQEAQVLSESKDVLVCLVHPFGESYMDPDNGSTPDLNEDHFFYNTVRYTRNIKVLISSLKSSPILIAEEEAKINRTREALRSLGYKGEILFYATKKNSAEPVHGNFGSIAQMILETGKQRIVVAGQYFSLNKKNGALAENLTKGISPTDWVENEKNSGCIDGFIRGISQELPQNPIRIGLTSSNVRM